MLTIPTKNFYNNENSKNSRQEAWNARWQEKLKVIKQTFQKTPKSTPWKMFKRQVDAFAYCDSIHNAVPFAMEADPKNPGKRVFLASSHREFWSRYIEIPLDQRHYYEVIREGAPCRFYFDLEFVKEVNPEANGDEMVQVMKQVIIGFLWYKFPQLIRLGLGPNSFVDLSSSNEVKFSRHLILHLPGYAFRDQRDCGHLVDELLLRLNMLLFLDDDKYTQEALRLYLKVPKNLLASLYIWDKGEKKIFIDNGVYTKNRNFRMYQSCKMGKPSALTISSSNTFPVNNPSSFEFWLATLASHVEYDPGLQLLTNTTSQKKRTYGSTQLSPPSSSTITSLASPFPKLDEYLSSFLASLQPPATIKNVSYFPTSKHLLYHIVGNRFCHRIQRQHKSNNTYYVVELEQGIFTQRCFDPDCRGYKSPSHQLPPDLNPFLTHQEAQERFKDTDLFEAFPEIEIDEFDDLPEIPASDIATPPPTDEFDNLPTIPLDELIE